jgi:hypothetical protein
VLSTVRLRKPTRRERRKVKVPLEKTPGDLVKFVDRYSRDMRHLLGKIGVVVGKHRGVWPHCEVPVIIVGEMLLINVVSLEVISEGG